MESLSKIMRILGAELKTRDLQRNWFAQHRFLIGDLHNHCGISYGHGKLEDAIGFANQQLDFFSVTGHFAWPDMTSTDGVEIPPEVITYHREGFARLRDGWDTYRQRMMENGSKWKKDDMVAFLSFEFHSFTYGDYTIIVRDPKAELPTEPISGKADLRLEQLLATVEASRDGIICMPHHIGYKEGFRGISWSRFSSKASPVVEIVSMHGCAESHRSPLPYLHTMGPRTGNNTMQGGLAAGLVFGVTGSTDHHNASPGSYGCGRTGLWSTGSNRDDIWDSLCARRTCALTGDPIEAVLFIDDAPIGSVCLNDSDTSAVAPATVKKSSVYRTVDAYVVGCDALERVEILQNNRVIARLFPVDVLDEQPMVGYTTKAPLTGRIGFAFGWGEKHVPCHWQVSVSITGGVLSAADPRLRGVDIVDPLDRPSHIGSDSSVPRHACFTSDLQANSVFLEAITLGNPNATTDTTQGFSLEVSGSSVTRLHLDIIARLKGNTVHRTYSYGLSDIMEQPLSEYIDGFVSPAFSISRFIPLAACSVSFHGEVEESPFTAEQSFYYLRAFQTNGDSVWTSAIFSAKN